MARIRRREEERRGSLVEVKGREGTMGETSFSFFGPASLSFSLSIDDDIRKREPAKHSPPVGVSFVFSSSSLLACSSQRDQSSTLHAAHRWDRKSLERKP
jgi:hypothetical protein